MPSSLYRLRLKRTLLRSRLCADHAVGHGTDPPGGGASMCQSGLVGGPDVHRFTGPWFATLSSTPDPPSTTIRDSSTACDGSASPASMNCPNLNVARGDMLVGPRPSGRFERFEQVAGYNRRHDSAGNTGWRRFEADTNRPGIPSRPAIHRQLVAGPRPAHSCGHACHPPER